MRAKKKLTQERPAQQPANITAKRWKEVLLKRFCFAAVEASMFSENQGSNDWIKHTLG